MAIGCDPRSKFVLGWSACTLWLFWSAVQYLKSISLPTLFPFLPISCTTLCPNCFRTSFIAILVQSNRNYREEKESEGEKLTSACESSVSMRLKVRNRVQCFLYSLLFVRELWVYLCQWEWKWEIGCNVFSILYYLWENYGCIRDWVFVRMLIHQLLLFNSWRFFYSHNIFTINFEMGVRHFPTNAVDYFQYL